MTEQPIEQRTNPPTRFRAASTALRSCGHAHWGLRETLRDRSRSVEIVAAVQTRREMERADKPRQLDGDAHLLRPFLRG